MSKTTDTTAQAAKATTRKPARKGARKAAEAVLVQSQLPALLAAHDVALEVFGRACVLTDEIARVQNGLPEDPTDADHAEWDRANATHNATCKALLDYQPLDLTEFATLATMFKDISVCDPEDGIEALARMAAGMSGAPTPPPAPKPTDGGPVAEMLASRQEFSEWLERTELDQPAVDEAVDALDEMDRRIARAPLATPRDAAAKLQLLLAFDAEDRVMRSDQRRGILAQVALWLAAVDTPPLSPADAELIAMAPEWDRLEAEWTKRNAVRSERLRAANRERHAADWSGLSEDQRFEAGCAIEARHGVKAEDADTDAVCDIMDELIQRARNLNATTAQALAVKVGMCAFYHSADGDNTETDELLRNIGLIVGRPFMMARVDGAEFYTPRQWVKTWLGQGGTFTRSPHDGRMYMGSPCSPSVEYLMHMQRSVGLLPNDDGSTTEPPAGFLKEVWQTAGAMMDDESANVLADAQAQVRREAFMAERLLGVVAAGSEAA